MATHSSILAKEIHGQRRLVGYSPWDHKESDITEQLTNTHWPLVVESELETSVIVFLPDIASLITSKNFQFFLTV